MRRQVSGDEGFRWRGEDVWRVEGFCDAVFAFAVTLLVVSLEVPGSFDELLETMRGFFAFAICFALLLSLWYEHYKFSRRYGLRDTLTLQLNAVLLFLVLFFVYPLKFLFTLLADQLLGFSDEVIEPSQVPLLLVIYGAGFVAVQMVFVAFYWRAYSLRGALKLDAYELSVTHQEIQSFLINVLVGLASVLLAILGGAEASSWAGMVYLLIFPLQAANSYVMRSRRAKWSSARSPANVEGDAHREEEP
jgi:uncharacterized membrane protein